MFQNTDIPMDDPVMPDTPCLRLLRGKDYNWLYRRYMVSNKRDKCGHKFYLCLFSNISNVGSIRLSPEQAAVGKFGANDTEVAG
jgi:hypothetical protein